MAVAIRGALITSRRVLGVLGKCGVAAVAVAVLSAIGVGALLAGTANAAAPARLLVRSAQGGTGFDVRTTGGKLVGRIPTGRTVPATAAADSPDGRRVAFVGTDSYLWVVSTDGKHRRRLVGADPTMAPVWSPDGRSLAIREASIFGRMALVAWPSGRMTETQLTNSVTQELWFSPDGWLWAADDSLVDETDVDGVPPSGSGPPQPWGQPTADVLAGNGPNAAISRDGRTAAFLRLAGFPMSREAVFVQPRGGAERELHAGPASLSTDGSLAFSPDGRLLAINWDAGGIAGELWLLGAGGSAPRTVKLRTAARSLPAWSPGGKTVAIGAGAGVALVGRDGRVRRPSGFALQTDPSWTTATGTRRPRPRRPHRRIVSYVALGDSYSSGHGVPPYDPATNVRSGPKQDVCHRSTRAYSRVLEIPHFKLRRSFFACSGATTANVTSVLQYPGEHVVQLGHTAALRAADLVTITIGGNDVRFDQVLKDCTRVSHNCNHKAILDRARNLEPKLISTYAAIRAAVPATAAVLVLDYPQLFPKHGLPIQCQPDERLFTRSTQRFLRRAASRLRTTIADAARRAGVQFVDVMPIFAGHEICGPQGGWINHILLVPKPGSSPPVGAGENVAHPNRSGQAAYARAIAHYIRRRIAAHARLTPAGLPADPPPQS